MRDTCKKKRARSARRGWGPWFSKLLTRLSLVLGATAIGGLTGGLGVQCGGASKTSVTTTHERIGPDGTSAENASRLPAGSARAACHNWEIYTIKFNF